MDKKAVGLVLVLILAAAIVFWRQTAINPGPIQEIILGVDFSDTFSAPVLIAESQGYFRDVGLTVKIIEYPSGRTALADMLAKKNLDAVTVAQTPVMYNSFANGNYAVIAGMAYSYEAGSLMLARRDKGIYSALDLKGRKIGTPVGSTGHFFLNLFLLHNGLTIPDVEIIDIDAPSLPRALADGRVEAITVWQPQIYLAQKLLGEQVILLPAKDLYRVDFYLVANQDILRQKPEALKRLLKAVDRAEEFILQNEEKAIDIIARRMKMDGEIVAAIWDSYQFKLFLDQAIVTDLEAEARWAIANKLTKETKVPDYGAFIYPEVLGSVKPETVNIIR